MRDEDYLRRVLTLAKKGAGMVSPNPLVGAVVVKDGRVVGEGFHRKAGEFHAEVSAIQKAGSRSEGATLYLNLEPCVHFGRTPPCADFIISKGIKRVVCSMEDPNPLVSGNGFSKLRQAGIEVDVGKLEKEASRLNEIYLRYVTTGLPFVILKWAQTLDGRIATRTGESKWISSESSRRYVHRLRSHMDAVLVGVETVLRDDPRLSPYLIKGRPPVKIVMDSKLRIPLHARVFQGARLILATTTSASKGRIEDAKAQGAGVWLLPSTKDGLVDMIELMKEAGRRQITSILIEGGSRVAASALKAGIVNKLMIFIAPKLLGDGTPAVSDLGIKQIMQAPVLKEISIRRCGTDLIYTAYL